MDEIRCRLIVFFDDPFWVGVFERNERDKLTVSKITFGAEPKEYEVYEWILKHYDHLQFSPAVSDVGKDKRVNPKRRQREVKKQVSDNGIGTKSWQALKLQREQFKVEKKEKSRKQKQAEMKFQFELRQQKKKQKHKGR